MVKLDLVSKKIIDLAYEINKAIKIQYGTEKNFCEKTKRHRGTFNVTLNNMKKGKGVNLKNILKILEDLNLNL